MNADEHGFNLVNLVRLYYSLSHKGDSDESNYPQILAEPRLIPAEYISAAEIG